MEVSPATPLIQSTTTAYPSADGCTVYRLSAIFFWLLLPSETMTNIPLAHSPPELCVYTTQLTVGSGSSQEKPCIHTHSTARSFVWVTISISSSSSSRASDQVHVFNLLFVLSSVCLFCTRDDMSSELRDTTQSAFGTSNPFVSVSVSLFSLLLYCSFSLSVYIIQFDYWPSNRECRLLPVCFFWRPICANGARPKTVCLSMMHQNSWRLSWTPSATFCTCWFYFVYVKHTQLDNNHGRKRRLSLDFFFACNNEGLIGVNLSHASRQLTQ